MLGSVGGGASDAPARRADPTYALDAVGVGLCPGPHGAWNLTLSSIVKPLSVPVPARQRWVCSSYARFRVPHSRVSPLGSPGGAPCRLQPARTGRGLAVRRRGVRPKDGSGQRRARGGARPAGGAGACAGGVPHRDAGERPVRRADDGVQPRRPALCHPDGAGQDRGGADGAGDAHGVGHGKEPAAWDRLPPGPPLRGRHERGGALAVPAGFVQSPGSAAAPGHAPQWRRPLHPDAGVRPGRQAIRVRRVQLQRLHRGEPSPRRHLADEPGWERLAHLRRRPAQRRGLHLGQPGAHVGHR